MSSNSTQKVGRSKRPRAAEDFEDCLTCSICCEYFQPPVLQCVKGHSYCSPCVGKMTRLANKEHAQCAVCHTPIRGDIRNYAMEQMLERFYINCRWDRCSEAVSLYERETHEKTCVHKPRVECYFTELQKCNWTGFAEQLPQHLSKAHGIQELTRASLFRYLWNPPVPQVWRYRYRILKLADSGAVYILEHFYSSQRTQAAFLVRALSPECRRRYRISILDRSDPTNKLSFEDVTPSFAELGTITDFASAPAGRVLVAPLEDIHKFCFDYEEDGARYFSLHIELL